MKDRVKSADKFYNYLGLATRAGQVVSGEYAVEGAVRRGKVVLLIIAVDASENTRRKFSSLARNHNVKAIVAGEKDVLGQAMGKPSRAIVGLTDRSFANVIQESLRESVQENN
ncbi:L7Ae/L30e/S12e/Gadd45 family ribosomal protein [Candidatus Darwinibacter acetoxidans]|jgi:ribosomal protein L7Ae-like RNA K-turn-binding protein